MSAAALSMWVIYYNPTDYPGKTLARRWDVTTVDTPTNEILVSDNLLDLRVRFESMGLVCLGRSPEDDPVILEVWV